MIFKYPKTKASTKKIFMGGIGFTLFIVMLFSSLGLQKASANEADCVASGGKWETERDHDTTRTVCKNCPVRFQSGGETCITTTTDTAIDQPDVSAKDCSDEDGSLTRDNCGIVKYVVIFINILSATVGIVVTAVIIWGGIAYSTSGGDPSKVQAAKQRIYNGIIALVVFIFSFAFLQYIVPGGIL